MERLLKIQKEFFYTHKTKDIKFRINSLKILKDEIKRREKDILVALKKDLGKSDFEGYATEIGIIYEEINLMVKNLKKWSKVEKVKSPLTYYPSKSYIYKEPYGVTLIIGPFNYPFQLIMAPLVGAIGAGNCAIIKASEHSINTSKIVEEIINSIFEENYIRALDSTQGKELVSELLDLKFDYIFFTGSVMVGKIVMEKAAKNLIPITLELGGKSPCIVDKDANIKMAAKRIVWGKFMNAGQTCVAPDYLLLHKDIKDIFLNEMIKEIKSQYGENHKTNEDYPRVISAREIKRLASYLEEQDIYYGGDYSIEEKYFSPTIVLNPKENSKLMEDEIFGPIMPVVLFEDLEKVIDEIIRKEKPLALYYFSEDNSKVENIINKTTSGGVVINDTVIHVATPYLPFGGVGNSGMGSYHGKESFLAFSHKRSVMKRGTFIEFPIRFAPFKDKLKMIKKVMK